MKRYDRRMTVANLRENLRPDATQVVFLESARFYWLLRDNPAYALLLEKLREAMKAGCILNVTSAAPDSDIIEDLN